MSSDFDFLVIGSGIAGLSFALDAANYGRVVVLCKGELGNSNTAWAQGGISAVSDFENDSFEQHLADTVDAGAGLCDKEVAQIIIREAPAAIEALVGAGVSFDRAEDGEGYDLGQEGGHSARRILHAKDTTGREISDKLIAAVRANPMIDVLEYYFAIDLITTVKLGYVTEERVLGCYALNTMTNRVEVFRCDRILLATGGCGKVYLYTTNPDGSTGDGVAMAWRAGAPVSGMEFIQFHPTCFYNPRAEGAEARSFLISEAVRGEGGRLIDRTGREFVLEYDERGSLAPRDIVARAIDRHLKRTGDACVFVDISHREEGFVAERFPLIYKTCMRYGVDPSKEPIPVVPAAHYQCGGVVSDVNGQSRLRGLFVAGEVGHTGLHGANRLASNSLLEGVVVARRALRTMLKKLPLHREMRATEGMVDYTIPEWHYGDAAEVDERVVIYHNWDEIRRLMWDYVAIVRTDKRLQRAARRLRNLRHEVRDFYWGHHVTADILELRNLVTVASLIVDAATRRRESRGLHFTIDHPEVNPELEGKFNIFRRN